MFNTISPNSTGSMRIFEIFVSTEDRKFSLLLAFKDKFCLLYEKRVGSWSTKLTITRIMWEWECLTVFDSVLKQESGIINWCHTEARKGYHCACQILQSRTLLFCRYFAFLMAKNGVIWYMWWYSQIYMVMPIFFYILYAVIKTTIHSCTRSAMFYHLIFCFNGVFSSFIKVLQLEQSHWK